MTADDLIAYWSRLGQATIHPDDVGHIDTQKFATSLHPVPWAGPLKNAKAYLLFLNPGLSPDDESYEGNNAQFCNALRANMSTGTYSYFYLLSEFAKHPGYSWARTTFGSDIRESHTDDFCVLQLVPYHSRKGSCARQVAPKLPSSKVVRQFVNETLVPRARTGEIGLVVARSARLWKIDESEANENIVIYHGWECRRAFQTKNTRGGVLLRRMISAQA